MIDFAMLQCCNRYCTTQGDVNDDGKVVLIKNCEDWISILKWQVDKMKVFTKTAI